MAKILDIFFFTICFAILIDSSSSLWIAYSENRTIYESKDPAIQMSNSTIKKIYEIAEQITNLTYTDTVLMQLQRITPAVADNSGNIMILVVKKSNITNTDIMDRFGAYYIHTAKADSTESVFSTIWQMMMSSTRNMIMRRVRSMFKRLPFFPFNDESKSSEPSSSSSSTLESSTNKTGRTIAFPIVFRQYNETVYDGNHQTIDDPKVVLLIPEPFYPPNIEQPRDNNNNETKDAEKIKEDEKLDEVIDTANLTEVESIVAATTKVTELNSAIAVGVSPSRYLVRPISAFSGLSVNAVDKTSTSVGTMITNTGLHLSLIGPSGNKAKALDYTSWRNYFRAFGHGFVFAKIIG